MGKFYAMLSAAQISQYTEVMKAIGLGIKESDYKEVDKFYKLFAIVHEKASEIVLDEGLKKLLEYIKASKDFYKFMDVTLEFLFKLA